MNRLRKTLIFGLDGYDLEHAKRLADGGRLPWLKLLLDSGSLITTRCSVLPGSEWVNAACGVDPSHHGYLHTSQLRVGTYESVETDARVVKAEPFYVPLARAGHKTIVVDLCVDRPRPGANLLQVIDWATEFKLFHYCTTPASLRKFVDRTCPDHPMTDYPGTDPSEANLLRLNEKLNTGTAIKGRLIRHLMSENPDWAVFFAGFGEIHKGGHFFWQYQDPSHPQFGGNNHPLAGALDTLYEHTDQQMMQICETAGPDTNVLVVADRGMRANFRGDHLVETMLMKLGLLRYREDPSASQPNTATGPTATLNPSAQWQPTPAKSLTQRLKSRIPVPLRPLARRLLGKERLDWRNTRVFTTAEVGNTYLRINLKGREPMGCVGRDEYDDLLNHLEAEFLALVDPDTGRCPVREVVFPHNSCSGPLCDELPDFGVVWAGDGPIRALESPNLGRIEGAHVEQRSGNHTERGGILLSGPDFRKGAHRTGDLRELAPTLLALHGVPLPAIYEFPAAGELHKPC